MTKQEREVNLSISVVAFDNENPLILMGQDPKEKRDYKINLSFESMQLLKRYFRNSK
jgi:hypothetical protein